MQNSSRIIRRERWIKSGGVIGLLTFFGWILLAVDNMLVSFLLAFVISYLFKPIVYTLERNKLSPTLAIGIPFLVGGIILTVFSSIFFPIFYDQFQDLQSEIPKYQVGITKLIVKAELYLENLIGGNYDMDFVKYFNEYIAGSATDLFKQIPNFASRFFTVFLLAPFFSFFILRDGRKIIRQFLQLVPNNIFELALNLNYQINQQMGDFIRARLLEALIVGAVIWTGLAIIGFPYAFILSLFAALTNLIPYIGPFIGAIPALTIAIINNDPSIMVILIALTYLIAQLIDIIFIIPLVVAKIVNLHPVFVVVVIIIGSQLMGITGMIISIPVASALKLTISAIYKHILEFRAY